MNKENSPDFSVTVVVRKNPFWISPIYVSIIHLHRLRFLIHSKQDTLIMRNRGPGAAIRHSAWKTSKISQCQICLGWKLCTVPNVAYEKSKISCMLSENLLHICSQFLSISALPKHCLLISALGMLLPYLSPDLHGPHLPFSCKFTSVKLPRWIRRARFPHYLMGNSSAEASFSETYSFCSWPPPHGYTPRHDANLTIWHTAFSLCTPARWRCVLGLCIKQ